MTSSASGPLGVAVPAYAHPVLAPQSWRRLGTLRLGGGFVVLNVADGPGDAPDATYLGVAAALRERGQPVCGYVDTAFGRRSPALVLRDAARYAEWYGITGVFLDQVASGPRAALPCRRVVDGLRAAEAGTVVLNPGVVPDPAVAALGDVVVTFEGTWRQHRLLSTPPWLPSARAAGSLCHLVYAIPPQASVQDVVARAAAAGAGVVGVSSGDLPNPWSMIGPWLAASPDDWAQRR